MFLILLSCYLSIKMGVDVLVSVVCVVLGVVECCVVVCRCFRI